MPSCARCRSSEEVRHSHRVGWDRLLGWFGLIPFRCETCGTRFYRFGPARVS